MIKYLYPKITFLKFAELLLVLVCFSSCVLSEADDPVLIHGLVTDSSGAALPDATVTIKTWYQELSAKTSSDGNYSLTLKDGGVANITFSKPEYTSVTSKLTYIGGAKLNVNQTLNTLKEDAFFKINKADILLPYTEGSFTLFAETNVLYTVETNCNWLWLYDVHSLYFNYDENKTTTERSTVIKIKAEYGITNEIKVTQKAGPVLKSQQQSL